MISKVWYREKFCPFEQGGPWLVGKRIIEADVVGAESHYGTIIYSIITSDGEHTSVNSHQVIFSQIENGKKVKNTGEIYPEIPFSSKKESFWCFMTAPIIGNIGYLLFLLLVGYFLWPALIVLLPLGFLPLGNMHLNYKDYKESLQYIRE